MIGNTRFSGSPIGSRYHIGIMINPNDHSFCSDNPAQCNRIRCRTTPNIKDPMPVPCTHHCIGSLLKLYVIKR